MRKTKRQWIVFAVGLVVVLGVLVGVKAGQIVTMVKAGEAFAPPPESVTTAKVESAEWESARTAVASLVALQGVTVAAELPGTVREISFESGASVKRGQGRSSPPPGRTRSCGGSSTSGRGGCARATPSPRPSSTRPTRAPRRPTRP
jgi:hypothetical protein